MFKLQEYKPPLTIDDINHIMHAGNWLDILALRRWWRNHNLKRTIARDLSDESDIKAGRNLRQVLDTTFKGEIIDLEYDGHTYTVRVQDIDYRGGKISIKHEQSFSGYAENGNAAIKVRR